MTKNLDEWNNKKKELQLRQTSPKFSECEVFWCSIGINVGDEEDGKSSGFNRPVLILRKFNRNLFIGVPLTMKIKESNPYYLKIQFQNNPISALISQIRVLDAKRLGIRMGKLSGEQFEEVKNAVKGIL